MSGWQRQGVRYVIVGMVSNAALYLLYLGFTAAGVGHKTAMTLLYAVGTLQTFVFNKRWTFAYHGQVPASLLRYLAAYGACYIFNFTLLWAVVDGLGFPHALVQGLAILGLAVLLFLLQKFWVFHQPSNLLASTHETVRLPRSAGTSSSR